MVFGSSLTHTVHTESSRSGERHRQGHRQASLFLVFLLLFHHSRHETKYTTALSTVRRTTLTCIPSVLINRERKKRRYWEHQLPRTVEHLSRRIVTTTFNLKKCLFTKYREYFLLKKCFLMLNNHIQQHLKVRILSYLDLSV